METEAQGTEVTRGADKAGGGGGECNVKSKPRVFCEWVWDPMALPLCQPLPHIYKATPLWGTIAQLLGPL